MKRPPNMSEDEDRLAEARTIAGEGAALARRYFDDLSQLRVEQKGVQDFVTQADREVESLIRDRISERFPGEGFIGEESGRRDGDGAWIVDPIDGTANFMRGLPTFAVSLAYVDDRLEPRVGVIEEPARGLAYWARSGAGAHRNGDPIRVSRVDRLDRCAVSLGFWTKSEPDPFFAALRGLVGARCDVRRVGSSCLGLCYTAAGHIEGFWQWRINAWDVAAGILLVREAGGCTLPFFARGGLDGPAPLLATNADLAETLAERVGASWDAETPPRSGPA